MVNKYIEKLKSIIGSPISILWIAFAFSIFLFSLPEHVNFLLEGGIDIIGRFILGVALMLFGVLISRYARAAFSNGDANGSTKYVVPAVYIANAFIVGCAILSV